MKVMAKHVYWVAVGWKGWRARRMKCIAASEDWSVMRGFFFNRVICNADVIAEYRPTEKK